MLQLQRGGIAKAHRQRVACRKTCGVYAKRNYLPIQSVVPTGLHPVALPRLPPTLVWRHALTGEDWESPRERTGMSRSSKQACCYCYCYAVPSHGRIQPIRSLPNTSAENSSMYSSCTPSGWGHAVFCAVADLTSCAVPGQLIQARPPRPVRAGRSRCSHGRD
jgi:hypothetical protein